MQTRHHHVCSDLFWKCVLDCTWKDRFSVPFCNFLKKVSNSVIWQFNAYGLVKESYSCPQIVPLFYTRLPFLVNFCLCVSNLIKRIFLFYSDICSIDSCLYQQKMYTVVTRFVQVMKHRMKYLGLALITRSLNGVFTLIKRISGFCF